MKFIPSKYQKEIFTNYLSTNKNIVINACPGSGKTRTILELLKLTPPFKRTAFLAFNKSIATELRDKVPQHIDVLTVHSLGMKMLYKVISSKIRVTDYKSFHFAKQVVVRKFKSEKEKNRYLYQVSKIVNFARLDMVNDIDIPLMAECRGFSILNCEVEDTIQTLKAIRQYNNNTSVKDFMVDYTDMLYLPLQLSNVVFPKYDVLFIDEVQDISPLQKCLIDKIISPRGRFVAVGDKKQLIYEFIGANLNSFNEFEQHPNTLQLPLSVSYRCPKSVIAEANDIFNDMEHHDGSIDGEVIKEGNISMINEGDTVLCRNNLPLIELFLILLNQNKKCTIYGKDYGEELLSIMDKIDINKNITMQYEELLDKVKDKLKDNGVVNYTNHPKYISLLEKITIIKILTSRFGDFSKVYELIDNLFSDENKSGVLLSTIHKYKGLENDTIFIYKPSLIPSKHSITPDQLYAEKCLMYVAVTRAKKKLIYIE